MQKTLDFLERYVQWFVLGIAVVYIGLMAYGYLVQPPITVKVGQKELEPGEVDQEIQKTTLKELSAGINGPKIEFAVADPVPAWVGPVTYVPPLPNLPQVQGPEGPGPTGPGPGIQIAEVRPPPVQVAARSSGRSVVSYPDPSIVVDEKHPAPSVMPMINKDCDWVINSFHYPMPLLKQAFLDAKIPADPDIGVALAPADQAASYNLTQFLRVQLIRQEKLPTGEWGPEMLVPPLPPYKMEPLPPDTQKSDQLAYRSWAREHIDWILRPPFLTTVVGQPWYAPNTAPPAVIADAGAAGGIPGPDEALRAAGGGTVGPVPGRPPLNRLPPGRPNVPPPAPPAVPVRPAAPPPPPPRPVGPPPAGGFGIPPRGAVPFNPADVGPQTLPGAGSPDGKFSPAEAFEFDILAPDITIDAGKTYRYKLRYTILNPVWDKYNNVPPTLAAKFALTSPDSEWTPEFTVPPRLKFYIVKVDPRKGADFDIFTWKNARWDVTHLKELGPGDPVGNTTFTVVDIRTDPAVKNSRPYALLADQNGQTTYRDPKADALDPEFQQLRDETAPTAAAPVGREGLKRI